MYLSLLLASLAQSAPPINLEVDARQVTRGLFFATEQFPAKPGVLTLQYPNWMPGAHSPAGSQGGLIRFEILADGTPLPWKRDLVEMNTVRTEVPEGAKQITVKYTVTAGGSAHISRVQWFRLVWYPQVPSDNVQFAASLILPDDWKSATALPVEQDNGNTIRYKAASLTRLVDSPCLIGRYYRQFDVTGHSSVPHYLDVMADTPEGVNAPAEIVDHVRHIHDEAEAIIGDHHYRGYHWLLSVSDFAGGIGLEHHESSEDGADADAFGKGSQDLADLVCHEYFHSFNGKFRRPIGLCTPDYQVPMKDDLLWVYEGLTQFMGQLLACRAGFWTPEQWREQIALNFDDMNCNRGREWRTLEDTAAGLTSNGGRGGASWGNSRRGQDYYVESTIVWLNVDMRIRQLTDGKKSLMDFLHIFHGGPSTGPEIKPYKLEDIVSALNKVTPYDWAGLLRARVYDLQPDLSQEAFQLAGWHFAYTDKPNEMAGSFGRTAMMVPTIGLRVSGSGEVQDVVSGYPADKAMMCPSMTITTVNGTKFTTDALVEAIRKSPETHSIKLTVTYKESKRDIVIDYSGGLRYPHIVRDEGVTDRLPDLLTPLTK